MWALKKRVFCWEKTSPAAGNKTNSAVRTDYPRIVCQLPSKYTPQHNVTVNDRHSQRWRCSFLEQNGFQPCGKSQRKDRIWQSLRRKQGSTYDLVCTDASQGSFGEKRHLHSSVAQKFKLNKTTPIKYSQLLPPVCAQLLTLQTPLGHQIKVRMQKKKKKRSLEHNRPFQKFNAI